MEILRYTAFSSDPTGGNPAGVVLDATGATDAAMLAAAAEVGYSETAFLLPHTEQGREFGIRYFSPVAEVSFCGHATIATAVAHARRHGTGELILRTQAGIVTVTTDHDAEGNIVATLTSVAPRQEPLPDTDLAEILAALDWDAADLDPAIPPAIAYAGAFHPILGVTSRERLARLDYDFDQLGKLMAERDWTTVALVFRASQTLFHARNPFPPGGVVEDPATGASAAALGGYLRARGLVDAPAQITILQGHDLGRPGLLTVTIPAGEQSGISVTGTAVPLG
jgi:PhzF family phenazine biosynthesis protein